MPRVLSPAIAVAAVALLAIVPAASAKRPAGGSAKPSKPASSKPDKPAPAKPLILRGTTGDDVLVGAALRD
ncbi:MAG: hypothetical protein JWM86_694, partial [Thermoleophilia bacterium]|nr:hypothetical protein [Thermoleophilia bacterium]